MTGSERPSILLVAYHFAPDNAAGTHRAIHFARSLHDRGYEVYVLTVPEDYARTTDPALNAIFPWEDHILRVGHGITVGNLYLRLKRRLSRRTTNAESAGGADGPRSAGAEHSASGRRRDSRRSSLFRTGVFGGLRKHLSAWDALPDLQRAWYRPAVRAGLQLGRRTPFDAVFASGPPWTGVRVAHRLSRELGCPLIVDFRDPWTARTGRQTRYPAEWCHRVAEAWEKSVFDRASLVLFNSPQIMEAALRHYDVLEDPHVVTILNGSDAPRREVERPIAFRPPLLFRHFGTLYRGRSVVPLVHGLQRLIDAGSISPDEVRVELFGRTGDEEKRLDELSADGVQTDELPTLPYGEALSRMMEPAVLVVSQPSIVSRQIPTKLYDYLCTGNPILVIGPERGAAWSLASSFPGCWRLDHSESAKNQGVLAELIAAWRVGSLVQRRSVEDTAALSKERLGTAFTRAVDDLLGRSGLQPGRTSGSGRVRGGSGEGGSGS